MNFIQVCSLKNNQALFASPPDFGNRMQVNVIVDDLTDDRFVKIVFLKDAFKEPLFRVDLKEIQIAFDLLYSEKLT